MQLKFRDYSFITFISLFPFILLLLSLKFSFSDKFLIGGTIFWILIIILTFIFVLSFIISLFYTLDHIIYKQDKFKVIHLILLVIFSLIYVPFYYSFFMINEKSIGVFVPLINILLITFFGFSIKNMYLSYSLNLDKENILIKDDFTYLSKDELFTIETSIDYSCDKTLGEYVVSCDNKLDDSFIGIYNYDYQDYSMGQLDEIYRFHLNQSKTYIKDAGYEYIESLDEDIDILTYNNDMCVLMKKIDYDINNDNEYDYRLIIIKEVLYNENMINDFNNLINSIQFVG